MKTALNEFIDYLSVYQIECSKETMDFYLEKEKQQIIEAYKQGAYNYNGRQSEDYFNETFNNGN